MVLHAIEIDIFSILQSVLHIHCLPISYLHWLCIPLPLVWVMMRIYSNSKNILEKYMNKKYVTFRFVNIMKSYIIVQILSRG